MHALAATSANKGPVIAAVIVIGVVVVIAYFTPSIAALFRRGAIDPWPVVIINLFLGWTLVGWVVALAMACRSVPVLPPPPYRPPVQGRGRP